MVRDQIPIDQISAASGVKFGTSGVRGLVSDMTDYVCYAFTRAFLQYLDQHAALPHRHVAIAGDLRSSTGRIMAAVAQAVRDQGYQPLNCGRIPSPALANYGFRQKIPSIMVTGSHIPDDRNGIKFTRADGEILKDDETGILAQAVTIPDCFTANGALRVSEPLGSEDPAAGEAYLARWTQVFPSTFLEGMHIGCYQHSAVGRDLLTRLLRQLGARVTALGRSDIFVPVDTEAIRDDDVAQARDWAQQYHFDAIVSTDGDSDRPLIADEHGAWLRGDLTGILCAKFCRADVVVTPISSNTAVERCGWIAQVRRTHIGSPFVIAEINRAVASGAVRVVGYEANGGFLIATPLQLDTGILPPLPTRDPMIVLLAILGLCRQQEKTVSALLAELPARYTASDRLQRIDTTAMAAYLEALTRDGTTAVARQLSLPSPAADIDLTDGVRITLANEEILHLRLSGNAPELRCYAEAATLAGAKTLVRETLTTMKKYLQNKGSPLS